MAPDPMTEPADVRRKIQHVRSLLAILERDFDAVDSMRWTLFKQRVDPLIEEIERLLDELQRQAPNAVLGPMRHQLYAYMRARLRGPRFLSHTDQA